MVVDSIRGFVVFTMTNCGANSILDLVRACVFSLASIALFFESTTFSHNNKRVSFLSVHSKSKNRSTRVNFNCNLLTNTSMGKDDVYLEKHSE